MTARGRLHRLLSETQFSLLKKCLNHTKIVRRPVFCYIFDYFHQLPMEIMENQSISHDLIREEFETFIFCAVLQPVKPCPYKTTMAGAANLNDT